jgi:hypothetical protein
MIDLGDLRAKAMAATPGPWRIGTPGSRCKLDHFPHGRGECRYTFDGYSDDVTSISRSVEYGPDDVVVDDGLIAGRWDYEEGGIAHEADAAYIAAANPQVVLALIARVEELEARLCKP